MSDLLRSAAIRRIESAATAALPPGTLMARAADAVVDATTTVARSLEAGRPIVAWVGPGNNGGDALLAALRLREYGFAVRAIALDARRTPGGDAGEIWRLAHGRGLPIEDAAAWEALLSHVPDRCDAALAPILIDGLFGIGLQRPLGPGIGALCERIAQRRWPVVAVDVPSGIDADTGARVGAHAVSACVTVTMIADKPGLHTGAALDHAGVVRIAELDIDDGQRRAALDGVTPADRGRIFDRGPLFDRERAVAAALPRRANDTSKGSFGSVLCYGGAPGMRGAALLAASGAQAIGVGRIYVGTPQGELFDPGQPQWMSAASDVAFGRFDAIAIGCGLGDGADARAAVRRAIEQAHGLVVDADALNAIAADETLADALAARGTAGAANGRSTAAEPRGVGEAALRCIVTPHPLEAARLLQVDVPHVQSDRIRAACALAAKLRCVALLKGAGSVVATPEGRWSIIDAGSPALASAGTGDVLAGACAALLARGLDAERAACLGAWLHGAAGQAWAHEYRTEDGLSAAELHEWMRRAGADLRSAEDSR
ncbi:MAG: NAD(P)H-hydrate dehydratase [Burkholderiaceae bacterium]|nr:NAD(P)H-hydrate dehydratase [Burkholderiaceae bacterium]